MPKIIMCLLEGKPISIAEALALRDEAQNRKPGHLPFRCDECGRPVDAHKAGTTGGGAHFEHEDENLDCPYFR